MTISGADFRGWVRLKFKAPWTLICAAHTQSDCEEQLRLRFPAAEWPHASRVVLPKNLPPVYFQGKR